MVSTGLTRARRSQAALSLDPLPASKVQSAPLQFAELDRHNTKTAAGVIESGWLPSSAAASCSFKSPAATRGAKYIAIYRLKQAGCAFPKPRVEPSRAETPHQSSPMESDVQRED